MTKTEGDIEGYQLSHSEPIGNAVIVDCAVVWWVTVVLLLQAS